MIVNEELKKAYEKIEVDLELVESEGFYNHIKEWNFIKNYITNLQQENARLKDKIENATNFVDKYMDEWDFQDEVWQDMNDLLILLKEN